MNSRRAIADLRSHDRGFCERTSAGFLLNITGDKCHGCGWRGISQRGPAVPRWRRWRLRRGRHRDHGLHNDPAQTGAGGRCGAGSRRPAGDQHSSSCQYARRGYSGHGARGGPSAPGRCAGGRCTGGGRRVAAGHLPGLPFPGARWLAGDRLVQPSRHLRALRPSCVLPGDPGDDSVVPERPGRSDRGGAGPAGRRPSGP